MSGPLNGNYLILDLSERSPAAAIAGMVLSDLGAEVIRVEPEGGDPLRTLDGCRVWFRGQKSVVVGSKHVREDQWKGLLTSADAVITTAQPWTMKPAGLLDGYPNNDRQILAVLTAYPRTTDEVLGPRHGADSPVYGELIETIYGSSIALEGWRPGPIFLGWPHAVYGAAWMLQAGVLGALLERERTGKGQVLTTSLVDGLAIATDATWAIGDNVATSKFRSRNNLTASYSKVIASLFECGDGGWIQIHTAARGAFNRMAKLVGREDLVDENAGTDVFTQMLTPEVGKELWDYLEKTFKSRSASYWVDAFHKADVCCMPALKPGEALWLEQMVANDLVDILPDGERRLGKVAKFGRTPLTLGREVPTPGQHNALLLDREGSTHQDRNGAYNGNRIRASIYPDGARRIGPLDGILVLDFGFFVAWPFANRLFADLGARVIKIEELSGDPMRGPSLNVILRCHRGKESIAVDLKTEAGRQVIHELVKRADIVHQNMRDGAMARLGMDYETLRKLNPRIIWCHSSGYGNQGPWAQLAAFEPLHSALAGLLARAGGQFNPPQMYMSHMDYGCGLTSSAMCVAALVERERSGLGQHLEVPQVGAGMLAMSDVHGHKDRTSETFMMDYEQRGHAPTNALYRTSNDWIMISCYSNQEWDGVRRTLAIDRGQWIDYALARQQLLNESAVTAPIEAALGQITSAEAERLLKAAGVPCAIPQEMTAEQVARDPFLRANNIIVGGENYAAGKFCQVGHTLRFANANSIQLRSMPDIGEHTVDILRELGKSETKIDELIDARIFRAKGREPAASASGNRAAPRNA